jgi:hypothetical protein
LSPLMSLKLSDVRWLAQGHMVSRWRRHDGNQVLLLPHLVLLLCWLLFLPTELYDQKNAFGY